MGIAREVAAITGKKLSRYTVIPLSRLTGKQANGLTINIEDKKDCPLYTARIIRNVKVGPAPEWLKKRLELLGCRSVNSVVDITNYVLFELGEPLHAFDLDKIVIPLSRYPVIPLEIVVRRARHAEEIITIDGIKRPLDEEILVIASRFNGPTGQRANGPTDQPIALAGIMGGKETEVTGETKNILLEAAVFNPITVRLGRQKLGLQTESSYRFERGVDYQMVEQASLRAVQLIERLCAGRCVSAKSCGSPNKKNKQINLNLCSARKVLGVDITTPRIKGILASLGFKVKPKTKNSFSVEVPAYRPDVNLEIDLTEEIARIFGYESIPTTLPRITPKIGSVGTQDLVSLTKNILVGLGLKEVITYSLIDRGLLNGWGLTESASALEILNPLSKEQEVLRPTIIPGLSRCVGYNLNQKQGYVNIFEIGKIFSGSAKQPQEELSLCIALCGTHALLLKQGLVKEEVDFLHLKGILEALFERLGIKDCSFNTNDTHYGISVYVNKENVGILTRLRKNILEKFDIKNKEVFLAEIFLDRLFSYADLNKKAVVLPIYPGISRDISVILREGIALEDILKAVRDKGAPLLREARVVDYYQGKQIPAGFRGLTISCLYRSDERTLTEAEINPIHSLVSFVLADKFSAQIRRA
jgi:phenylalanyl-tRNA synthetase beta chain